MQPLAWHFDLHTPGYVRVNTNPDVASAARALRDAGVEEIITFAKCHFGYAYYPTRVGTPHPGMKGDAFGDFQAACKAEGLKVLAYISFGIDGQAGEQHPDWRQVGPSGVRGRPGHFISVCPFTPYTDGLMLPQIAEVIERYHPDGFFFDTMGAMGVCLCEACRKGFREAMGQDIPQDPDDPLQATYGRFRHDRGFALIARVGDFIQTRLPGAIVGFNQVGSLPYPERMPASITRLTLDPSTQGPQSLAFSLNAAYGSTADRPCDVMPTIFNQGWGDWSLSPDLLLRQVGAVVWARGARLYVGDRLHPQNRLDRRTQHALSVLRDLHHAMAKEMPPESATLVPDVLLVHSPSATQGEDMRFFFDGRVRDRLGIISGAHHLFLDSGANATVVGEAFLEKRIDRAGLVVLPEVPALAPETEKILRSYVERGGHALIVGRPPRVDGQPLGWLGLSFEEDPWQDHIYVPSWGDAPEVLVRGDFYRAALTGAEVICPAIPAWDARHGHRYGWGIGPACESPSPYPALVCAPVGAGKVWTFGTSILSDYAQSGNWQQAVWWKGMLDRMGFPRRAFLECETGGVELVVYADARTTWAVLVHHAGEQLVGRWARSVGPLPAVPVRLRVATLGRRVRQILAREQVLRFTVDEDALTVPLVMDSVWRVVRIEWE